MSQNRYLISIDGGTTNTRVYLWRGDHSVADRTASEMGVRNTAISGSNDGLKQAVKGMLQQLLQRNHLVWDDIEGIYASGMITSNLGLYELPHLIAPARPEDFARGVKEVEMKDICPLPIGMIPGVKNLRDEDVGLHNLGEMDMMRGEEAEALGIVSALQVSQPVVLVLPGSHTKFVFMDENGSILGCVTSMT